MRNVKLTIGDCRGLIPYKRLLLFCGRILIIIVYIMAIWSFSFLLFWLLPLEISIIIILNISFLHRVSIKVCNFLWSPNIVWLTGLLCIWIVLCGVGGIGIHLSRQKCISMKILWLLHRDRYRLNGRVFLALHFPPLIFIPNSNFLRDFFS